MLMKEKGSSIFVMRISGKGKGLITWTPGLEIFVVLDKWLIPRIQAVIGSVGEDTEELLKLNQNIDYLGNLTIHKLGN
jgi:hypothetical protein